MEEPYVAHGLQLHSTWPLPGMVPDVDEDLPSLRLTRVPRVQLGANWSARASPVWRGYLGDSCELKIERGGRGDLLFTYGDRACFHLDADRRTLTCAPGEAGLYWQRALLTKVLANVSLVCGREALHASAVDSSFGVIAILAPAGTGKTTLALELMGRGHTLRADDVLTLAQGRCGVVAHAATPHMNLNLACDRDLDSYPLLSMIGRLGQERWVSARSSATHPSQVRTICLLQRSAGAPLSAEILPASPLAIAPYMLGLAEDPERERQRFALYADLAASAVMLRLSCDSDDPPTAVVDLLERKLATAAETNTVGSLA